MTHKKLAEELQPGDVVIDDDGEVRYEVHAVEQHQGRFQVSDPAGATHTYGPDDTLEVE